jgi:hypothetical protein
MTDTTSGSIARTVPASPAFTTMGRIVRAHVCTRPTPTDPIARQQAIENALSAALHLVRNADTTDDYVKAVGRAIRAASMLKQACAERTADATEDYAKAVGRIRAESMLKQACTEATNGGRA